MSKQIDIFFDRLKKLGVPFPSPSVNMFFEKLYKYAITNNNLFIQTKKTSFIRQQSGLAEGLLEKYYAKKYIVSDFSYDQILRDFPYVDNYKMLLELEMTNISLFLKKNQKILFIGGGAFPLSAILLAQEYDCTCYVIDNDLEAVLIAKKIIKKLGLQKKIIISHKDIRSYKTNAKFDIVYAASLLFDDKNEEAIVKSISENIKGNIYAFRSADGMRQILYKKINTYIIRKYFSINIQIHPKNQIVNSVILCYKKSHAKKEN